MPTVTVKDKTWRFLIYEVKLKDLTKRDKDIINKILNS